MKRKDLVIKSLSEIGTKIDFYVIESTYVNGEKCNKCDENRQYTITTPDGEIHKIDCNCKKYHEKYSYVKFTGKLAKIIGFYKNLEISDKPIVVYKDTEHTQFMNSAIINIEDELIYKKEEDIKEYLERMNHQYSLATRRGIYLTQEDAQKVVNYLNSKED